MAEFFTCENGSGAAIDREPLGGGLGDSHGTVPLALISSIRKVLIRDMEKKALVYVGIEG